MAETFKVTFEQTSDSGVIYRGTHEFIYNDRTDANLHNLSVQKAVVQNAAELLAIQAVDPERAGRSITAAEQEELGLG